MDKQRDRAQPVATRDQIRELDRIAIEEFGIPGLILMENAGLGCVRAAYEMLGVSDGERLGGKRVTVICGRGNNAGDGFVIARHLTNRGAEVEVLILGEVAEILRHGGDPAVNLRVLLNMGVDILELPSAEEASRAIAQRGGSDLFVDAMLGSGVSGEVREPFRSAIEALNRLSCPVLAVDVPSGLDCDTGKPLGVAVKATRTVTFAVNKVGFCQPGAEEYTGCVEVAEISIPHAAIKRIVGYETFSSDICAT